MDQEQNRMNNPKFSRYGLLTIGAGVAVAAAGWLGHGAGGLLAATPNTATGYSTDTTTPSVPSTPLTPLPPPQSPSAAPTLPPATP
jgi:hypothetical protein